MPIAITKSATSTNNPTRNSVQVSCLRCAILRPPLFPCAKDYPTFTPEIASNMGPSPPPAPPESLRKIPCHYAAPQNACSIHYRQPHVLAACDGSATHDSSRYRNENLPMQNRPVTGASPTAPSLRKYRATAISRR